MLYRILCLNSPSLIIRMSWGFICASRKKKRSLKGLLAPSHFVKIPFGQEWDVKGWESMWHFICWCGNTHWLNLFGYDLLLSSEVEKYPMMEYIQLLQVVSSNAYYIFNKIFPLAFVFQCMVIILPDLHIFESPFMSFKKSQL